MKSVRAFVTLNHNKKLDFSSDASNDDINTAVEEYARSLANNMENTKYEVYWEWNQKVEAEEKAKEQIFVGAEFKGIDKMTHYVWKATIIKIAPESARLLIKGLHLAEYYDCDIRHGIRYEEKTGTITIDGLVSFIQGYNPNNVYDELTYLMNNWRYRKIKFIDVNGTPEEVLKNL